MSLINCSIESKSDFLTGMYLVTRIAESDLDENAFRTIQDDCPDFILPFNYRIIDGQMEFTYKVGTLCKLQYFYGEITHSEYAALWRGILRPLIECKDWFMAAESFVLCADYLYYDKNKGAVAYVYIPSVNRCSGYDAFREMATEIAKGMKVADPELENNVLRSIVSDFAPGEFLRMIAKRTEYKEPEVPSPPVCIQDAPENPEDIQNTDAVESSAQSPNACVSKENPDDEEYRTVPCSTKEPEGIKLFSFNGKKAGKARRNGFKNTLPADVYIRPALSASNITGITQETKAIMHGTGLRCIGRSQLPQGIEVNVAEGEVFTIGRHDLSAGKKRSSFEFDAKTKAVSRRHAAIERTGEAYRIIDLASSAGTFINNKKIPPNTPAILKKGCRVSFGNMGADYVWEAD